MSWLPHLGKYRGGFVVFFFFKDDSSGGREKITFVESAFSQEFCETNIILSVLQMRKWRSKGDLLAGCITKELAWASLLARALLLSLCHRLDFCFLLFQMQKGICDESFS